MRYAIFLMFDENAQKALQNLRENLAQAIKGIPSVIGKMGPHLTLAVFDNNSPNQVLDQFQIFSPTARSFELNLSNIDFFEGRKKVLYIAPQPSPELQRHYEKCHAIISENSKLVPAYEDPVKWHPHITITKNIKGDVFQNAKSFAEKNWRPVKAVTQTLGLINVQKPLEIISEIILK